MDMSRDVRRLKGDYNEFVTIARDLACEAAITDSRTAARAERKRTATPPVKPREYTPLPAPQPSRPTAVPAAASRPSPVSSTLAAQPTCFRCHKAGHMARDCHDKSVDQKAVELPANVYEETYYDATDGGTSKSDSEKVCL